MIIATFYSLAISGLLAMLRHSTITCPDVCFSRVLGPCVLGQAVIIEQHIHFQARFGEW